MLSRSVGKEGLRRIERVILGSADPRIVQAIARITSEDLLEPSMAPGAGLDLRQARIIRDEHWMPAEALSLYALSPIRALAYDKGGRSRALLTPGPEFNAALNRAMARRFGRSFRLTFIPDALYARARGGDLSASMAIKIWEDSRPVLFACLGSSRRSSLQDPQKICGMPGSPDLVRVPGWALAAWRRPRYESGRVL